MSRIELETGTVLYKFLPAKWAIQALKSNTLKVSRFQDFNDPYEAKGILQPTCYENYKSGALQALENILFLCLCKNYHRNIMWGHYADGGSGVVLGLEYTGKDSFSTHWEVDYVDSPIRLNNDRSVMQKTYNQLPCTKSNSFDHEEEVRILLGRGFGKGLRKCLKEGKEETFFVDLSELGFSIKEMIFGNKFNFESKDFMSLESEDLMSNGANIGLYKAKPMSDKFEFERESLSNWLELYHEETA